MIKTILFVITIYLITTSTTYGVEGSVLTPKNLGNG